MGNEMGNSNTIDLREEEHIADVMLGTSSPGSRHQDDMIIESELILTGKDDDHTDVGDTISDKREQPAASLEQSTDTGQEEDNEKQKAVLSKTSEDDGNSMDDEVRVQTDDQLESTDLSTKEPKTFMNNSADLKEPAERLNDSSLVSDSMDSGDQQPAGYSSEVSADFVPDTIREPVQNAEEVELEHDEVLYLEGNWVEKVTVSPTMESMDGDRGTATETKVTESGRNEPRNHVEENDSDGQNSSFDEFKEAAGSDESNDQPQCDEVLGFDCSTNDEDDIKAASGKIELNRQPRCDEDLGLEIASTDETTPTDVCLFESENDKQCHLEAEIVIENGFRVDVSRESSESVEMDSNHEEKESSENIILLEEKEATEASNLIGDDNCDGLGAADQFITSPAAEQFHDEESQTSDSSSSTTLQSSRAAIVSDFEFEELSVDLAEIPGASLGLVLGVKSLENGGNQDDEEPTKRLSSGSNSDSFNSNSFPQMQKSPSFDLDIQAESDQTSLLFQDKAEINILIQQDKAVMLERSDSEKSKTPLLGSPTPEEKEEQSRNIDSATPPKQETRGSIEKVMARRKERRSLRRSFFGMCMCCGIDPHKNYRV